MNPGTSRQWNGDVRLSIGKALLAAGPSGMDAKELAAATGRDPSNLRKVAQALVAEGLLEHRLPRSTGKRPGRQSKAAFALSKDEEERLREILEERHEVGKLRPFQQLVFVEAGTKMDSLMDALAKEETLARAAWTGLCDGTRQELMVAFEGSGAVDASLDLMAIFSATGLEASRVTLGKVESAADSVKSAQRRVELAKRRA